MLSTSIHWCFLLMEPKKVNAINKDNHSRKKQWLPRKGASWEGFGDGVWTGRMESLGLISSICDGMGRGQQWHPYLVFVFEIFNLGALYGSWKHELLPPFHWEQKRTAGGNSPELNLFFSSVPFFLINYTWFAILYQFQVCGTVIQYFYTLYFIYIIHYTSLLLFRFSSYPSVNRLCAVMPDACLCLFAPFHSHCHWCGCDPAL